MSKRLTDSELAQLERTVSCGIGVATAEGLDLLTMALAEIREHRAAQLTDEEREALRWAQRHLRATTMPDVRMRRDKQRAHDAIDKILLGGAR